MMQQTVDRHGVHDSDGHVRLERDEDRRHQRKKIDRIGRHEGGRHDSHHHASR